MAEFFDPSPRALALGTGRYEKKHELPFADVPVGKSFSVEPEHMNISTLRTLACRAGDKYGKQFKVINHGEAFEVFCSATKPVKERPKRAKKAEEPEATPPQPANAWAAEPVGNGPKFFTNEPVQRDPTEHYLFRAHCLQCHSLFEVIPSRDNNVAVSPDPNSWDVTCLNCNHVNRTPKSLGMAK